MSVNALPFVVAENHSLGLYILICGDVSNFLMLLSIYNIFLSFVFVVRKSSFVLGGVLVFRYNGVEIENVFVRRLQLSKNIICNVCIVCACRMLV